MLLSHLCTDEKSLTKSKPLGKIQKPTRSEWPDLITHKDVSKPNANGTSTFFFACQGLGKIKDIVQMRHKFCTGTWDNHCTGKKHKYSRANIIA